MEIKPPVAIAAILVVVAIVGFFLWRGTTAATRYNTPPPIVSGLSGGPSPGAAPTSGAVPLPGVAGKGAPAPGTVNAGGATPGTGR